MMGSDCIHSDPHEGVVATRESVIHAAGVRAMVHAARFFDQQPPIETVRPAPCSQPVAHAVRALADSVRWVASDDSEGGEL